MLDTALQKFVYYDKYARYSERKGRREHWPETVGRVVNFLRELSENKLDESVYHEIYDYILSGDVAPSMRLMRGAGKQTRRHPESVFNCAYLPIVSIDSIVEILWLSMCGVGIGYDISRKYTRLLPNVVKQFDCEAIDYTIADSTEGWVDALRVGLMCWWSGSDVVFNYAEIRPAGSPLKTKGGTASGPGVLMTMMQRIRSIILSAGGRQLKPVEVFDVITSIGDAAVSGGSRRSAQLAAFDFDDYEMRGAKKGSFWNDHPNRSNANISVSITKELTYNEVRDLLLEMLENGTGEPGLTSQLASNTTRPSRRREITHGGHNACVEINLQGSTSDGRFGGQVCNLSTVQVYPHDTEETLKEKARICSIIGTIQSIASDGFTKLLRPTWKEICAEERLLGVSLIGVVDNQLTTQGDFLRLLRDVVVSTNKEYAEKLGINQSASTTAVKPAGNSSVMYGTSRGINARYAPYYIRRVRVNKFTPMYKLLVDSGMKLHPEVGYTEDNANTFVAEFYEKSPDGAITIDHMNAIDQLEMWKTVKLNWCEHNPSVTIEYQNNEIDDIVVWIYNNQSIVNGISFLPRNDHVYELAPYQRITKEEYENAIASFPEIDFNKLQDYENSDYTITELECSAGECDLF